MAQKTSAPVIERMQPETLMRSLLILYVLLGSVIVKRDLQVTGEPEVVTGAVAHPGRQGVPFLLQLAAAGDCCPALKMPMLAAFTMPTENRTIRAVSWVRCRSTRGRCRTDGRFLAMIAVCGQAEAGNGADGSAGRGHGQQPAAGEHVDPRPPAGVLQPVAAAEDQRRGRQVLQRAA